MFSQEHRLRHDQDIEHVLKKGQGVFDAWCGVKWTPGREGQQEWRLTVVAGHKVSKLAVRRNRVRRQYREIMREFLPTLKGSGDMVLFVGKSALEGTYEQKKDRLRGILQKAKLV